MLQVSEFVILRLVCSLFYGLETLVTTLHYSQDGQASLPSVGVNEVTHVPRAFTIFRAPYTDTIEWNGAQPVT